MPKETPEELKQRARKICRKLQQEYPDATTELKHWSNPWQLLVATILSAQTTDEGVNEVTPGLFKQYPRPEDLARVKREKLEKEIYSTGFYHNKAKSLIGAAKMVVEEFGGEVPDTMEEMDKLPGVSRKTANVVLGSAFGKAEGIVVDTHVSRLALRMGLSPLQTTKSLNTDKIERDLMELIPKKDWISFGHCMTWHGRRVCTAKRPRHDECAVARLCPKIGTDAEER